MRVAVLLALLLGASSSIGACKDGPPSRAVEIAVTPPAASTTSDAGPATPAGPSTPPATSSAPRSDAPASDTCEKDADCILSTFAGCCSCCPCGALRAMTVSREASMKEACERKDCRSCNDFVGDCLACKDPAKEGMHARCIASACTLVETKAGAASPPPAPANATTTVACKNDDACWFDDDHHPIARPARHRGKKIRPCKDGEHAPACKDGACMVHHFKC